MVFIFSVSVVAKNKHIAKNGGASTYSNSGLSYSNNGSDSESDISNVYAMVDNNMPIMIWTVYRSYGTYDTDYALITKSFTNDGISYYVDTYVVTDSRQTTTTDYRRAKYQFNDSSITYHWLAIG